MDIFSKFSNILKDIIYDLESDKKTHEEIKTIYTSYERILTLEDHLFS